MLTPNEVRAMVQAERPVPITFKIFKLVLEEIARGSIDPKSLARAALGLKDSLQ